MLIVLGYQQVNSARSVVTNYCDVAAERSRVVRTVLRRQGGMVKGISCEVLNDVSDTSRYAHQHQFWQMCSIKLHETALKDFTGQKLLQRYT